MLIFEAQPHEVVKKQKRMKRREKEEIALN